MPRNIIAVRCKKKQLGFTLLEVLVAIFVLSAVALMFAAALPTAKQSAYMNGQYAQAASLCQHKIDQMRAVGFGRLTYDELSDANIIDASPTVAPFSFLQQDSVTDYLPRATATINVQTVSGQPNALLVTVTVSWKSAFHLTHTSTMTVSALITNQG